MTSSLRKYATPSITPAVGGMLPVAATTDGLPGYDPKYLGGFYSTSEYAAVRQFINGDGAIEYFPTNYPDYRLAVERLVQSPPLSLAEMARAIELNLRGQYEASAPYAYLHAWFNSQSFEPAPLPSAEVYYLPIKNEWDSGAVSTDGFVDRGIFSFTADAGAFAAVGIAPAGTDASDPHNVRHGFLLRIARPVAVIESGVITALGLDIYPGASATFDVRHIDGVTSYFVNGVLRLTTIGAAAPSPTLWVGAASLYGVNSSIIGTAVVGLNGAAARLPALRMPHDGATMNLLALTMTSGWFPYATMSLRALLATGGTTVTGGAALRLSALTATGSRGGGGVNATLPGLRTDGGQRNIAALALRRLALSGGDRAHASCSATLPALTARAITGRPVRTGGLIGVPRVRAIAVGRGGVGGGAVVTLPALTARSAYYSSAAMSLPRTRVLGSADPEGEAFVSAAPFAGHSTETELVLVVTMDSAGGWSSVALAYLVQDVSVSGVVGASGTISSTALLNALMNSTMIGASLVPLLENGAETWVLNVDSGATSMYESFPFNSFGVVDGVAYGAKSDGLYRLEGSTDAGLPIRASMSFGRHDFSTNKLKRLEAAYIGASSTGTMYLKVRLSDGKEYTYATRRSSAVLSEQRIDVGRGTQATYYEFELFNSDGCDFELDTVEFVAVELSRRI